MRGILKGLSAAVVVAALTLPTAAWAQEETITLDKVPKAVMDTFKARFKDAKPTGAAKETVDGKLLYEVTFKEKEMNVDVTISAEGELMMIEREIAAKSLPKAAAAAVEAKYPKATYKITEEIIKVEKKTEKLQHYEVLLATTDKKLVEVQVTTEGKIINVEVKKDGDK